MSHDEDIDAKLLRLANATGDVGPRAGFSNRVMARIQDEAHITWFALSTPARRFFPLGMLAACLAMVWAVSVTSQVDEALAASDDTELAW
jgi:hypothetical protein